MLMPCEAIIKSFLPAIRAATAKKLSEHELSQAAIAKNLGITQAAVSNYLSGKYAKHIKEIESNSEIQRTANRIAQMVAVERKEKKHVVSKICLACDNFADSSCRANKNSAAAKIFAR